ncbi:hypothetical protein T265_05519 [Opisthorchis viverrini]|uniref:Uncharacterized protein n=1 Tax=Opisthorchis viverrini TaxID=6198 RepID=A0A074ZNP5_OPIVI|nr:hypothetical protein T265_05519 [Opisthorchis viverrini]KER27412.1 hypothetical protein T265_05519 [Opisthorchis viverrini]
MKGLSVGGVVRLPGWGPRDHAHAWPEKSPERLEAASCLIWHDIRDIAVYFHMLQPIDPT